MQDMTYNCVFGFQGLAASIVTLKGCLMLRLGMQTAEFEQGLCVHQHHLLWGHNQRCLRSWVGVSKSAIVPSCLSAVCLNATRLAQELTARRSPIWYTQQLSLQVNSDDGVRQHGWRVLSCWHLELIDILLRSWIQKLPWASSFVPCTFYNPTDGFGFDVWSPMLSLASGCIVMTLKPTLNITRGAKTPKGPARWA